MAENKKNGSSDGNAGADGPAFSAANFAFPEKEMVRLLETYRLALAHADAMYGLCIVPESNATDMGRTALFLQYTDELLGNLNRHLVPMQEPQMPAHFLAWHFMKKYRKAGDASLVKMAYSLSEFVDSDFKPWGAEETRAYKKALDAADFFAMLMHADRQTFSQIGALVHELAGRIEKLESETRVDVLEFVARKEGLDASAEQVAIAKGILLMALEETSAMLAPLLDDFLFAVVLAKNFKGKQPDMRTLILALNDSWEEGNIAGVWLSRIAKHAKSPAVREFADAYHHGKLVGIALRALAAKEGIPAPEESALRKIVVRKKIPA